MSGAGALPLAVLQKSEDALPGSIVVRAASLPKEPPDKRVANNYGLLWLSFGLLWGIVAYLF